MQAVGYGLVTRVRVWNGGRDLKAEYLDLKIHRPDVASSVGHAIKIVWTDPDLAERRYSIRLDPVNRYLAMPFLGPDGLTCLVWRHSPDGEDAIEIIDFSEPWAEDLDMPAVWPRPEE
jgi:hypothetical protein